MPTTYHGTPAGSATLRYRASFATIDRTRASTDASFSGRIAIESNIATYSSRRAGSVRAVERAMPATIPRCDEERNCGTLRRMATKKRTARKPVRRRNPDARVNLVPRPVLTSIEDTMAHSGATKAGIELAEVLILPSQARALKAVDALHGYFGGRVLGPQLQGIQDSIMDDVLRTLRRSTDQSTFDLLQWRFNR